MSRKSISKRSIACPSEECLGEIVEYEVTYHGRFYGRPEDCYPDEFDGKIEACTGCGKEVEEFTEEEQAAIEAEFKSARWEKHEIEPDYDY